MVGIDPSSLMEKISEKIRFRGDDSSDSDDDDGPSVFSDMKSKVWRLFGREKPLHKVLGGGKPADIFLWRDKTKSAGVLGTATVVWILFELLEYHLITLVCHLLILALVVLYLWSNASTFVNKAPPRIPKVILQEKCVVEMASALGYEVNRGLAILKDIASGRELKKLLVVIAGLWVVSIVGSWFSFITLLYLTFILLFTVPVFYEKYEDQVDAFAEKAMDEIKKQYAVLDGKVLSKIPRGPMPGKKKD
ncbi:hypothetical protein MLD38_033518 [Melastoma candidum]|uniref:Uncharacterized protein n=1 Tax=Melastoma candidum TaxID=119954 RepID=A0ACB9M9M9_9MYRT|nr:hypothetical protein MLD38_033518 [Melastoma candidum]